MFKSKKGKLGIPIILAAFLAVLFPFAINAFDNGKKNEKELFEEVNGSSPVVTVVGNNEFNTSSEVKNHKVNRKENISDIARNSLAIVLSEDKVNQVFSSVNKNKLKGLLKSGKTVFLVGNQMTSADLADYLGSDVYLEEKEVIESGETSSEYAQYVTYNSAKDEYEFGVIAKMSNDVTLERLNDMVLMEAWLMRENTNRRGDKGKPSEFKSYEETSLLQPTKADAYSVTDRNVGSKWHLTWGPYNYTWTTNYGHTYERKRGYSLDHNLDEDSIYDYTALQMYWETVPNDSNSSIYQIKLYSDATTSSTAGAGLELYGPRNNPSNNSLSYSIGMSGYQAGMTATWSTSDPDLRIANDSCTRCGMLELHFNFDRYSNYAHQTTVHEPAFSYNAWQGASVDSIQMSNNRIVEFSFYNGYGIGSDYEASNNYLTPVPIYK